MFLRHTKHILPWLLLLALAQHSLAGVPSQLNRMTKEDGLVSSRIVLEFSAPAKYRIETSGQRIDLFFSDASAAANLRLLPEDDKIVKILLAKTPSELMVSLLLRQVPANITVAAVEATATTELEIFWQQATGNRPAVAFRISGLPSRQIRTSSSLPLQKSIYAGRWHTFFHEHHTPLRMDVPPPISIPTLPRFGYEKLAAPLRSTLEALESGDTEEALLRLQQLPAGSLDQTGSLDKQLLLAEALLRNGLPAQGLAQLESLPQPQLSPALQQRAGYLHNLALALNGDSYGAMAHHGELEKLLAIGPYRYPLQLLQAEIALVNDQAKQALEKLHWRDRTWPAKLRPLQKLRIADAQVASDQSQKALPHYRRLIKRAGLPTDHLYSMQQAARAFFENRKWQEAHTLYQQLATHLKDAEATSQAMFLSALATYRSGNQDAALQLFRLLREHFPGTQGDLRTRMKLLDHNLATLEERHLLQGLRDYPVIIPLLKERRLREEAIFKFGLTLHLHGEPLRAIDALGDFRRDYATSPLRPETEALLAEILAPVLEQLIARGEELQAVVLLEKYRELLLRGDGQWPFLPKLAKAFIRLGLVERGCRVYLYLLDNAKNDGAAKNFYLPLATLYFDRDEYGLAEKFSGQYLDKYPKGKDRPELFLLRLRALQKMARFDQAAELLLNKKYPRNSAIDLQAAQIYWELGDYNRVIDFANRLGDRGEAVPPFGLLLQAEALRRLGHAQQALPLFEVLAEDGTFSDQATYRCGQILLAKGERGKALNLFQTLAEKGKDGFWRQLARDSVSAQTY